VSLQAIAICPENPEPLQALASVQYEQGNPEVALATLRESISKWWTPGDDMVDELACEQPEAQGAAGPSGEQALAELPDDADRQEPIHVHGNHQERDDSSSELLPSYEFRVECCKLLLELDTGTDTVLQACTSLFFFRCPCLGLVVCC
jgi:hypothetical protein